MKRIVGLLTLLLFSAVVSGQSISGKVSDNSTGETLVGVNVVYGEGLGSVTDLDGKYYVDVAPGEYTIVFSYLGYDELTKTISVTSGESLNLNTRLKPASKELDR